MPKENVKQGAAFELVDPSVYARQQMDAGAQVVVAEKRGAVLARAAEGGEKLEVWTKNGNFEGAETAQKGDVILTRADDKGNPVVDDHGHTNTWKVSAETFRKKYDADHPDPVTGVYKPAGGPQTFVKVGKDVSFKAPWGEIQNIRAGGFLNITNPKDVYGIALEEFQETYEVKESHGRDVPQPAVKSTKDCNSVSELFAVARSAVGSNPGSGSGNPGHGVQKKGVEADANPGDDR